MIVFTGVAGSGKSKQGKMLADRFGLPWLSTGEFLRMLIHGDKRKSMLEGKLLGDKEIISLVQRMFSVIDSSHEFVLDGFPRTVAQADWLLNQAKHGQLDITMVLHLKASEQTVTERLLKRGRQDDTEAAIKERFREYEEAILPILDHFKEAGVAVIDVSADKSIKEVHSEIVEAYNGKKSAH